MRENINNQHYIHRSGWLRAAVLGANDGILSTASIAIGVASANQSRESLILATLAGLVAGTLSMAAGEYVSVSSQTDLEQADIERERKQLEIMPEEELLQLAKIYEDRGLSKETALQVAKEMSAHNALNAHIRDELGISELTNAKPFQAAFSSAVSFVAGGLLPLLLTICYPMPTMVYAIYILTILLLIALGLTSGRLGGSNIYMAIIRITFWGTFAMGVSGLVGHLFNVSI
jgi:vacuolar iron transporter family protein